MKLLVNVIVSAVVAIGVSYCSVMAHAQTLRPVPIAGLMCDTPDQVTRFLTEAKDATDDDTVVIAAINKDAGSTACIVAQYFGFQADRGASVIDREGRSWQLVHMILLGGVNSEGKTVQFPAPLDQWSAVISRAAVEGTHI